LIAIGHNQGRRLNAGTRMITIDFNQSEQDFLAFVFVEVFGGGSTQSIQNILGDRVEAARELGQEVRLQSKLGSPSIDLSADEWRVMYESINAVIYGLGPNELAICTGYQLDEVCNINLKICAAVWGAAGGNGLWAVGDP
jgi:hypothetical protein